MKMKTIDYINSIYTSCKELGKIVWQLVIEYHIDSIYSSLKFGGGKLSAIYREPDRTDSFSELEPILT